MSEVLAQFAGYKFRAIEPEDQARIYEWIQADDAHRGVLTPDFFMGLVRASNGAAHQDGRATILVLEDSRQPLMFIRLTRASRVHIQFPPEPKTTRSQDVHLHRKRIANALMKGMAFLEVGLRNAGATEWIFDSQSPALRALATRRMGFETSPHELVRVIPSAEPMGLVKKPARTGQQIFEEGA